MSKSLQITKGQIEKSLAQAGKELEGIRSEIASIIEEISWIEKSPLDLADAKKSIDVFIEKHLSDDGISCFFHQDVSTADLFYAQINFDDKPCQAVGSIIVGFAQASLAPALVNLLGPEFLKNRLYELATNAAKNYESGPLLADRPKLVSELLKRKRALEVEEEHLIMSAEEIGITTFYRRSDVDPAVVLMVEA
jgi:hypothetical protein